MPYASETEVPVERSRQQIEAMLRQRGCEGYASAWSADGDRIEFAWKGLRIRFVLPKVDKAKHRHDTAGRERKPPVWERAVTQAERVRWRGLYLVVKAKLEAVESGIATFEDEFLAYIMLPDGRTVGGWVGPQLQAAYDPDKGIMPATLPLLALEAGDDD